MILKNTIAIFTDGDYRGEYDWKGGIPLAVGEHIEVTTQDATVCRYLLKDKTTTLTDKGDNQEVLTTYTFRLA